MDTTDNPHFKKPTYDFSRFQIAKTGKQEITDYELYVGLTSKLINRSYIVTAQLVAGWSLDKIIRHYELCTKHAGTMPGDVKWWWLRKKDSQP